MEVNNNMNSKIANTLFKGIYCEIKSFFLANSFLKKYGQIDKYKNICMLVKKKKKLLLFPYSFTKNYKINDIKVYKDKKYYYTLIDNKKMYIKTFPQLRAKRYVKNIMLEQDNSSPHQYCNKNFEINQNDILLDIGAAEGYFTLKNIEKVKHAYLFECDPKWIKVLEKTFEPYQDKVTIIHSKISNIDNSEFQTIDTICSKYNINKVDFIKMDIEGFEEYAIKGMKNTIKNNNVKMAICCYHTIDQEKRINNLLEKEFDIETNDRYMIFYYDFDISKNFLRHGVLRCTKKI